MTSGRLTDIYLALGANLDPLSNLRAAVRLCQSVFAVRAWSSVYRTPPQGFTNQPDFYNLALWAKTPLTPLQVKQQLGNIEQQLGRVRDPLNKNAPRTIDLDLALWGSAVLEYGTKPWRVPDPDIVRFAHVALPLAELAPDYVHPLEGMTLAVLAERFGAVAFERSSLFSG